MELSKIFFDSLIHLDDELIKELTVVLEKHISDNKPSLCDDLGWLYDFGYEKDNLTYFISDNANEEEWEDQGKYQYNNKYYALCRHDSEDNNYVNTNICVEIMVSRSGSYFSDYYYTYDDFQVVMATKVEREEVVIPAHTEYHYL